MWGAGGLMLGQEQHLGIKGLEMPLKHTLNLSPWMAVTSKAELPSCFAPKETSASPSTRRPKNGYTLQIKKYF